MTIGEVAELKRGIVRHPPLGEGRLDHGSKPREWISAVHPVASQADFADPLAQADRILLGEYQGDYSGRGASEH